LTEPELVPIQAFVLGCTWPAVVANYISSRQTGEKISSEAKSAIEKVGSLAAEREAMNHVAFALEGLATSEPPPAVEEARTKLDELLKKLSDQPPGSPAP
jgi:hypothetical protein